VTLRSLLKLNGAKTSTLIKPRDQVCVPSKRAESVTYSADEIVQIIREVWPDELEDRAIAIARRESRLRPDAIGVPNNCCYGLFQIYYKWHKSWLPKIGIRNARQLLDAKSNALAALEIYKRNHGWGPWRLSS
jgi:soluble lytic murein transglycosylase-like protein